MDVGLELVFFRGKKKSFMWDVVSWGVIEIFK